MRAAASSRSPDGAVPCGLGASPPAHWSLGPRCQPGGKLEQSPGFHLLRRDEFRSTDSIRSAIPTGLALISVSQKRITRHPIRIRVRHCRRSRVMLYLIFEVQYPALLPRRRCLSRRDHPRPCQKSPSQNTATRTEGNTISGFPGRCDAVTRYRSPLLHKTRRRVSSGIVSLPRLEDMVREAEANVDWSPLKLGAILTMPALRLNMNQETYVIATTRR